MLTLTGNELVVIYPLPQAANYEATPDGYPVLTPEIVTLSDLVTGGGGGYAYQVIVNSGTTAVAFHVNTFVGFNSAASGPKTVSIPESTGSLGLITISDLAGTATNIDYITPVPTSGGVIGDPVVYTNFGSITLLDTDAGWAAI